MNKVTNINLGGYPFAIDQKAYHRLDAYFEAIENQYKHSEGFDEITSDIEHRIAEIINERLDKRQIITVDDVDEVISIMGHPQDFEAEASGNGTTTTSRSPSGSYNYVKPGKKIYRDPENKVVAGVCSGLAAYFGIQDPLWVRLGFVALFISGISAVIYPILWGLIPQAKTTSDRLAMQGEPINIVNIASRVEEEISGITSKLSGIKKDIKSKKKEMMCR